MEIKKIKKYGSVVHLLSLRDIIAGIHLDSYLFTRE